MWLSWRDNHILQSKFLFIGLSSCADESKQKKKSFGEEAYLATTDHGKLVMHGPEGETVVLYICPQVVRSASATVMSRC